MRGAYDGAREDPGKPHCSHVCGLTCPYPYIISFRTYSKIMCTSDVTLPTRSTLTTRKVATDSPVAIE
jgi:hypothetical protein